MDTVTETVASVNETTLKALTTLQEQVLAFHRDVSAAYAKAVDVPAWVPTPEPLADVNVELLVEQAFDFQAQRIETDKQFALSLVEIWSPSAKPSRPSKAAK